MVWVVLLGIYSMLVFSGEILRKTVRAIFDVELQKKIPFSHMAFDWDMSFITLWKSSQILSAQEPVKHVAHTQR